MTQNISFEKVSGFIYGLPKGHLGLLGLSKGLLCPAVSSWDVLGDVVILGDHDDNICGMPQAISCVFRVSPVRFAATPKDVSGNFRCLGNQVDTFYGTSHAISCVSHVVQRLEACLWRTYILK